MRLLILAAIIALTFSGTAQADDKYINDGPTYDGTYETEHYSGFYPPFANTEYSAFGADEDNKSPAIAQGSNNPSTGAPQTTEELQLQDVLRIEPAAGDETPAPEQPVQ